MSSADCAGNEATTSTSAAGKKRNLSNIADTPVPDRVVVGLVIAGLVVVGLVEPVRPAVRIGHASGVWTPGHSAAREANHD
jgi:hypothetical protein